MGQGLPLLSCSFDGLIHQDGGPQPMRPGSRASARGSQLLCEGRSARHGPLVCSAVGKEIFLYVSESGRKLSVLEGSKGPVTCLLGSGTSLFSGSVDRAVRRWDLETGNNIAELKGHDGSVWCLELIQDMLCSASEDATVICWDLESGARLARLTQHTSPVRCLLDVGGAILSGSDGGTLICWDLKSFEPIAKTEAHTCAITCLLHVERGGSVFSGAADGSITRWNQHCRDAANSLEGHVQWITCLLATEEWLFSGSRDGTIKRWDLETGVLTVSLELGTISLRKPAGFLVATEEGSVCISKMPEGEKFIKVDHEGGSMSFLASNGLFLSASPGGAVGAGSESIGDEERFDVMAHRDGTISLRTTYGTYLSVGATADAGAGVSAIHCDEDIPLDPEKFNHCLIEAHWSGVTCLQMVSGCLMSGAADRSVKLWDPNSGILVASLDSRTGITCLLDTGGALYAGVARGNPLRLPRPSGPFAQANTRSPLPAKVPAAMLRASSARCAAACAAASEADVDASKAGIAECEAPLSPPAVRRGDAAAAAAAPAAAPAAQDLLLGDPRVAERAQLASPPPGAQQRAAQPLAQAGSKLRTVEEPHRPHVMYVPKVIEASRPCPAI
mmetsp:Transcript_124417/g.398445  ORF Transcript_124417/g.398445 Transcript_124417/m.398445 type:complete len:617 (-) Transcript_124417:66-1916(-)